MGIRWYAVNIDATDPARLARWWAEVLRLKILDEDANDVMVGRHGRSSDPVLPPGHRRCGPPTACTSTSPQTTATRRSSGWSTWAPAMSTLDRATQSWVVMSDPEGNVFCVLRSHPGNPPTPDIGTMRAAG